MQAICFAAGLLCAAPANCGWYRAVTLAYYEAEDEVLIRFVDYGGYSRLPRCDLRQIRLVSPLLRNGRWFTCSVHNV